MACIHLWHGKSTLFQNTWWWQHIEHLPACHLPHPSPSAGVANSFDQVAKNWDTKKAKNRHNPLSWSGPEALAAAGLYYHSLTTWRLELWIANAALKNLWKSIPSYLRGKRIRILMKARSLHTCAFTTQRPLLHLFELEMIKKCLTNRTKGIRFGCDSWHIFSSCRHFCQNCTRHLRYQIAKTHRSQSDHTEVQGLSSRFWTTHVCYWAELIHAEHIQDKEKHLQLIRWSWDYNTWAQSLSKLYK